MAIKKFGAHMRLSLKDGITRPAKKAENSLRGINKAATGASSGIAGFNSKMRAMRRRGLGNIMKGAMILAPGVMLAKSAMTWEKGLAKISTMTDSGMSEIKKKLSNPLMNIASDIGVDLDKISEATYQALSAGIPEDKVLVFVRKASKLAVGGHTDVITSVDALSSSMNAWGVTADRAMEMLSYAQRFGKTTVGEIGQSIGQVSKLADTLNISMQETTGSIATLTKVGLKTPQATAAVKGMLTALVKQSPKALKITEKLGFAFNKETIQAKGLMGTLRGLVEHINAHTDSEAERAQLLAWVIGRVRGLNSVLNLTSKDGMATYNEFMKVSTEQTGEAQKNYKEMSKTQLHQWKKLKIQLKKFSIVAGQQLLPVLKVVGKQLGNILKPMMVWIQKNPVWTKRIMMGVAALGALKMVAGSLQLVFGTLGPIMAKTLSGLARHPALGKIMIVLAGIQKLKSAWENEDWKTKGNKYHDKEKEVKRSGLSTADKMLKSSGGYDIEKKQLNKNRMKQFGTFKAGAAVDFGGNKDKGFPYRRPEKETTSPPQKETTQDINNNRTAFGEMVKQLKNLKKEPAKQETTVNYSPNITVNTTGAQTGADIKRVTDDDFKNKMQILKKNQQRTEL